jgi:hypothetical protein
MTTTKTLTKISFFFDELDFDDDFFPPESKLLIHFPGLLPFPITSTIAASQSTELKHQNLQ